MGNRRWKALNFAVFLCFLVLILGQILYVGLMNRWEPYLLLIALIASVLSIHESRKNREFRFLVENAPYAILLMHNEEIIYINDTGKYLIGADEKSVIGHSLDDFIQYNYEKSTRKIEKGHKFKRITEGKIEHPTLGEIDAEIKIMPITYRGESCEYIVIRDITELKKGQELIQQTDKLSMIGEMAAGIAHEIRNPLTSLKGFAQLLQDEKKNAYSEIMVSEIDRINTIVDEMLLLAKPKKLQLRKQNITNVLNEVVFLLDTQAILHNIQIKTAYNDDLKGAFIHCEENKLKQVFINILKNSIEAMEDGGLIDISMYPKAGNAVIRIADNGSGIPADMLTRIGKAFFTTKEKGTGLGLMICQTIIQEHGGQMTIDSVENQGTTVEILLPIIMEEGLHLV
ncbi:ATP-binding protein [Bacillus sp. REN16]|uniref:ATP-binding protein n=1 Tax=Bacillus sp. REN16 TaxID=2887296 RepID=UPI001E358399|nr:ATP-binding protein [Bacillus sp. REN16]MCC3358441.1 PAS domain S-box protein [Bacillus sp. REN16]